MADAYGGPTWDDIVSQISQSMRSITPPVWDQWSPQGSQQFSTQTQAATETPQFTTGPAGPTPQTQTAAPPPASQSQGTWLDPSAMQRAFMSAYGPQITALQQQQQQLATQQAMFAQQQRMATLPPPAAPPSQSAAPMATPAPAASGWTPYLQPAQAPAVLKSGPGWVGPGGPAGGVVNVVGPNGNTTTVPWDAWQQQRNQWNPAQIQQALAPFLGGQTLTGGNIRNIAQQQLAAGQGGTGFNASLGINAREIPPQFEQQIRQMYPDLWRAMIGGGNINNAPIMKALWESIPLRAGEWGGWNGGAAYDATARIPSAVYAANPQAYGGSSIPEGGYPANPWYNNG